MSDVISIKKQKLIDLINQVNYQMEKYGDNLDEIKGRILSLVEDDNYCWDEDDEGKLVLKDYQRKGDE